MSSINTVLLKFINGDAEAMCTLIDTYQNDLYKFCFRLTNNQHDAEDLFQQTWIKVIRNSDKYKNISFKSWLFRICLNQYKDNYRRQKLKDKHFISFLSDESARLYIMETAQSAPSAEAEFEKRSNKQKLVCMINKLPEKQKIPIILHYFHSLKYSEIAKIMEVSEGTIKSRISTAKKNLKSLLESEL